MNTLNDFDRRAAAWLADGPTELHDRALEAALREIHLTHQRRALRAPWRFRFMPALTRAAGIAALTLVIAVGAGGLVYLGTRQPSGAGGATATLEPSFVARGITAWRKNESSPNNILTGYPADWSLIAPATRRWQIGDQVVGSSSLPFADSFVSPDPEDAQIGLLVWKMPAGNGADIESVDGLKAWADRFCTDGGAPSCDGFTAQARPMCLYDGGLCHAAILVPTATQQYAFFPDLDSLMYSNDLYQVRIVVVTRPDAFASANRYGGSVELLKAILTTQDVWTPGQERYPPGWIAGVASTAMELSVTHDTSLWVPFTSSTNGIDLRFPPGWAVTAATQQWV